jgi:hypothetical protein
MDLASRKYKFIEQFMKIASVEKIERLEKFFKKEMLEEELSEDLKKVLDLGILQIEEEEIFSTEEVITRIKTKYNLI